MTTTLLTILTFILFPLLVVYLCYKFPALNKIGIVIICYITGITAGNIGILPDNVLKIQENISNISIVLALPLLLFSMNVKKWSRLAGKSIFAMFLATISITAMAFIGSIFIKSYEKNSWQLAGMAVGVYTGGTPNLAAIKAALSVEADRFILFLTYDTFISMIYILFCVTIAQRVFSRVLPKFVSLNNGLSNEEAHANDDIQSYEGITRLKILIPLGVALLLSVVITGLSVFISSFVPQSSATSVIILLITSMGIGASFIAPIRKIEKTFQLGMGIIYIFCFTVGSMARFDRLMQINVPVMLFIIFCIFGSMLLHALMCILFKIDTDTFIITSVSAICSPPFVPVVADALKNQEIILSGLTTGIIGYAIGNYLGISVAYIFKNLF